MTRCHSCDRESTDGSRFCPHCGAAHAPGAPGAASPTRTIHGEPPQARARQSSGSLDRGRFLPGAMLAGRYRIFGIIGRGGMGEVYRADDLKLGQPVALKFLPVEVEQDPERLSRFHDEVRIARQISHPNVCRVYDVGEVDGHHFLSMELVDGEDLASLLRRIGRLPRDKAIEIARQLCAGLAAAHEQGVLHRDLKPANIMIDGRGRARITDFGLARVAGEIHGVEVTAGTPAFMAPEQMTGKGVTVRSDLYSLGLVLYELCTGQPAFRGTTPAELARQKNETTPTSPSHLVEGLDPAVERVILRCLEKDPAKRPVSALQVAAALPGGDPLAAALAAGETPSPELVAEAGAVGGLTPGQAWACLAALIVLFICVVLISGSSQVSRLVPLPKSPDVLSDRARDIVRTLGYTDPPIDTMYGFGLETEYVDHLAREQRSHPGWDALRSGPPYAVGFWYRQSPRPLAPGNPVDGVDYDDPPPLNTGMIRLRLDPEGRLREFEAVPPEQDTAGALAAAPDWDRLLTLAGFDPAALTPVSPAWAPLVYADTRAAWEGTYAQSPGAPLRIEAASYRGKPVALRIVRPWTAPTRMAPGPRSAWQQVARFTLLSLLSAILVGGTLVARRNVRLGRGDRKGARRLATFVFATMLLDWLLEMHHAAGELILSPFLMALAWFMLAAAVAWIFYLALEPYLRRLWPEMIVSWVRLLDGRLRDPLVGRDVLIGLLAGAGYAIVTRIMMIAPAWAGIAPLRPDQPGPPVSIELAILRGLPSALGNLAGTLAVPLVLAMGSMILLLICRLVLRNKWLAFAAFIALNGIPGNATTSNPLLNSIVNAAVAALMLLLLFRLGLLAYVVTYIAAVFLLVYPMTFDTTAWYIGGTVIALASLLGVGVFAFRVALAGRPALGAALDPEARSA
jgi:serine/threonine-protein kinase